MHTEEIVFDVITHDCLDSTNEEAKRLLAENQLIRPTIIRAVSQTAGKGTQGRKWLSPPGAGLYFSLVHPFQINPLFSATAGIQASWGEIPLTPLFTLAAGVACAATIRELTGLAIQLKPINDLYIDGHKLGGILTESLIRENQCKALITGIGINIFEQVEIADACNEEGRGTLPTSLQAVLLPHLFDRWHPDAMMADLMTAIARQVDAQYYLLVSQGEAVILTQYMGYKVPEVDFPVALA